MIAAMDNADFDITMNQLVAAADLIAAGALSDDKADAYQMSAFFRLAKIRPEQTLTRRTSDDELFKLTALAALRMAGQKQFLPAAALLVQARTLFLK